MPIPIKPSGGNESSNYVDYSFLSNFSVPVPDQTATTGSRRMVTASDNDASNLYKLWSRGTCGEEKEFFDLQRSLESAQLTAREITRLKTMGFVEGDSEKIEVTARGKRLICTISLSEPNKFELKSQRKPYSEILAGMDRKKKGGLRTAQYNDSTSNNLDLRSMNKDK